MGFSPDCRTKVETADVQEEGVDELRQCIPIDGEAINIHWIVE